MRVLLDACVPERFARFVPGHEVTMVRAFFGTTDVDDGPVLDRITAKFEAFVTVDKICDFSRTCAVDRSGSCCCGRIRTPSNILCLSCRSF